MKSLGQIAYDKAWSRRIEPRGNWDAELPQIKEDWEVIAAAVAEEAVRRITSMDDREAFLRLSEYHRRP